MKNPPFKPKLKNPGDRCMMQVEEQKSIILGILINFREDSVGDMFAYMKHVGFDVACLRAAEDLPDAWCAFYQVRRGEYDVDRASRDLLTWPPIAARIEYLRAHPEELDIEV